MIQSILSVAMACEYKEFYGSFLDEFQKCGIIFLVVNSAVTYFKILRKIDPYLIWKDYLQYAECLDVME